MNLLIAPLLFVLAACAPPIPLTIKPYTIPVVKEDNTLQTFTVEPEPGEPEKMLFCIESPEQVLCVSIDPDGHINRYVIPIPQADMGA